MVAKTLEVAMERAGRLSSARQDEIAGMLDRIMEHDDAAALLSDDDWTEIDRRLAARARYASDAEVEAFFEAALK